jgi:hypothetical protein
MFAADGALVHVQALVVQGWLDWRLAIGSGSLAVPLLPMEVGDIAQALAIMLALVLH